MALSISGSSPSFSSYQGGTITSGTAVASTSGTSIDFTSIPSWVKRITVMINAVSTNGTNNYLIQIGSGSITSSGYLGVSQTMAGSSGSTPLNFSSGFIIQNNNSASVSLQGTFVLTLLGSNVWTGMGITGDSNSNRIGWSGGSGTLSGVLDRVRFTTVGGTDTFDAGSINILYE